ncbi:MAG: hypothetical protein KC931_26465 [Candidatus Omnitrophica bacterium]|nr:hypothetical protein [Candidatus Omnitrophota bacterium]
MVARLLSALHTGAPVRVPRRTTHGTETRRQSLPATGARSVWMGIPLSTQIGPSTQFSTPHSPVNAPTSPNTIASLGSYKHDEMRDREEPVGF